MSMLSFGGWIVFIIAAICFVGYKSSKSWPKWAGWVGIFVIYAICAMLFPSTPSFTGNIEKDARIMNERLRDGDDADEISDDLAEYYIDNGYGLSKAKEVLRRATELNYDR